MIAHALRLELNGEPIRVTEVAPGMVLHRGVHPQPPGRRSGCRRRGLRGRREPAHRDRRRRRHRLRAERTRSREPRPDHDAPGRAVGAAPARARTAARAAAAPTERRRIISDRRRRRRQPEMADATAVETTVERERLTWDAVREACRDLARAILARRLRTRGRRRDRPGGLLPARRDRLRARREELRSAERRVLHRHRHGARRTGGAAARARHRLPRRPSRAARRRRRRQRAHPRARRRAAARPRRRRPVGDRSTPSPVRSRRPTTRGARPTCGSTSPGRGRAPSPWTARLAPREPDAVARSLAELADAGLIDPGWAEALEPVAPTSPRSASACAPRSRPGAATFRPATACCARSSVRSPRSRC